MGPTTALLPPPENKMKKYTLWFRVTCSLSFNYSTYWHLLPSCFTSLLVTVCWHTSWTSRRLISFRLSIQTWCLLLQFGDTITRLSRISQPKSNTYTRTSQIQPGNHRKLSFTTKNMLWKKVISTLHTLWSTDRKNYWSKVWNHRERRRTMSNEKVLDFIESFRSYGLCDGDELLCTFGWNRQLDEWRARSESR